MIEAQNIQQNYRTSHQINELADALCKAQSQIEGAKKDSLNPHFKNNYADLASVWDACREALTSNGIAVLQPVTANGAKVVVTTMLSHKSGQWISSDLEMTALKSDPQAVGSAITYGRRYGLSAMVGIAPEDDDGNAASAGNQPYRAASPAPKVAAGVKPPQPKPVAASTGLSTDAKNKLAELKAQVGDDHFNAELKKLGHDSVAAIPSDDAARVAYTSIRDSHKKAA